MQPAVRGNGVTVTEAIVVCLNRAQKMAQCEIRIGHKYFLCPEYTNGYVTCELCGFNGFSPQMQTLKQSVDHMKIHIKILQEQHIQTEEALRKPGLRWTMKDFMETLEKIPRKNRLC
jgi:hypothetical protein